MSYLEIKALVQEHPSLKLRVLEGEKSLDRHLSSVDVNRPGLALAGFFRDFASDRIQVFGKGEWAYLQEHSEKNLRPTVQKLFSYKLPGIVFTHDNVAPKFFRSMARKQDIPLMVTLLSTHNFILQFTRIIGEVLASRTSIHGVLLDVFGVGILLMGSSGIGKSETALELVERGHRLVADDIVQVICLEESDLYGMASEMLQHRMELRGLGIINVKDLFGIGAVRDRYPLDLVVYLEDWDSQKEYERLGLDQQNVSILSVQVPRILLPIRPGRNIPILIETAAINHRSQQMGYHAARDLSRQVSEKIQDKIQARKRP